MKNIKNFILFVFVVGVAYYLGRDSSKSIEPGLVETASELTLSEEIKPQTPEIQYPLPKVPPEIVHQQFEPLSESDPQPLPFLDKSDDIVAAELASLYDSAQLDKIFIFKSIIRYFVVSIDNMLEKELPNKYRFTRAPTEKFLVDKADDESVWIAAANYDRYLPYVKLVEAVDLNKLLALYLRYYPLIQEAYQDLGYLDRHFNDRFVKVIDHLLETPEALEPVKLLRSRVLYAFADRKLEDLSAGQKILIRTGNDNASRIKVRLLELRRELTNQTFSIN